MWPKAFAQLIELAPHVSRLLPMADRFFQSKAGTEDAQRKSLDALEQAVTSTSDRLRSDLNGIALSHAGLTDQVGDLGKKLSRVADDSAVARLTIESLQQQLSNLESRQSRLFALLSVVILLLVALCVLGALLFVHHR